MDLKEKLKRALIERSAEGLAAGVSVVLLWFGAQIAPAIVPAISGVMTEEQVTATLLASLALNVLLALIYWILNRKPDFTLKYGIYWDRDKNPHCPNCRKPVGAYGQYQSGKGYYCKPCKIICPVTNVSGNDIDPADVMGELSA